MNCDICGEKLQYSEPKTINFNDNGNVLIAALIHLSNYQDLLINLAGKEDISDFRKAQYMDNIRQVEATFNKIWEEVHKS